MILECSDALVTLNAASVKRSPCLTRMDRNGDDATMPLLKKNLERWLEGCEAADRLSFLEVLETIEVRCSNDNACH